VSLWRLKTTYRYFLLNPEKKYFQTELFFLSCFQPPQPPQRHSLEPQGLMETVQRHKTQLTRHMDLQYFARQVASGIQFEQTGEKSPE